ncbi:MAG TPA: DUF4469 domain-containing protein [Candidatus Bacteroides merdipullorum]|uniref:DUF4469 domain-containing protein n=1 Tax=Candidatus Bacteroides merdipullorum TaxID=2838474 RepID=A0A9D2A6W7_9BACE|nr:DUF4469 domain-containing protein [Candidatus Bacteroides merdipullorum]
MATKEPTQKSKFSLKALELSLTTGVTDDYYLQPKLQKCLSLDDLAVEVAALSARQEDAEDIARTGRDLMKRMMWFLSSGYSISTPLGYFRPTAQGVFRESELNEAINRSRLKLGVRYSMSDEMRQALADAEIDVDVQKGVVGPQLYAVVSGHDADHPDAVTRGEGVPVSAGQICVIKGRNLKVGGNGEDIGVTITRVDGSEGTTYFFPVQRLYPNTLTRVGFVMPADAPDGSVWSVKLCTQLGNNGIPLKAARSVTMDTNFVIGEVEEPTPEDDDDSGQGTFG